MLVENVEKTGKLTVELSAECDDEKGFDVVLVTFSRKSILLDGLTYSGNRDTY